MQLLERIRRRVEMSSREMEIDRGVRQIGMAKQELDRPQVGARFQQMRRVRVPQRILTLPMNRPQRSFTTVTIRSTANT